MAYYHVFIFYRDKAEKLMRHATFGCSEAFVKERYAVPYMENEPFMFVGSVVDPSRVEGIYIFESEESHAKDIILSNGKPALDQENAYVVKCFVAGKVKGVIDRTHDFVTLPPKIKEKAIKAPRPLHKKEKVFIVHGRDENQALRLQKYLTKTLKIDAEMFEDFKERSGSNTIIEQLEHIQDNVGYVFVIVTPDDVGCLREDIDRCKTTMLIGRKNVTVKSVCEILDNFHTRARQNVVFEHGLFIGALGRDRVCCLLKEDTKEKPSDIDGILYVGFKKSVTEKFSEIAEKLKKVGLVKT